MQVVCLEEAAFYALIDEVVKRIKTDPRKEQLDDWISDDEAMAMLRISSRTTLQKFRDTGKIRFSQPEKKIILYYRPSILDYIEKHANETF